MNIAMINCGLLGSTGGIMRGIADCAVKKGHKVLLVASGMPINKTVKTEHSVVYIGNEISRKINVFLGRVTGLGGCFAYFATRRMLKRLDAFEPDLIHLHNLHESYINLKLLFNYIKKKNIKVVWTLHDCWAFTGNCAHFQKTQCVKWKTECKKCPQLKEYPKSYIDGSRILFNLKKNNILDINNLKIVTPSKWLADLAKESFFSKYPITVINNGIDLSVFKPTDSDFRKKYNISKDKFIVLGVKFAWCEVNGLDIFKELSQTLGDEYQIVMVGTDKEVDAILPENIISINRTKNQSELAEIYSAADVFINPSRAEVLGMVSVESLACGTPIIVSNVGGCPETVSEQCGQAVDVNAKSFEIAIRNAKKHPFAFDECISFSKKFNKDILFEKYVDLYE